MKSSIDIQIQDEGDLVYFICDVKELFGVDLSFPGIKTALNYAFNQTKYVVPIQTRLMLRSYTIKEISSTAVMCFFDPKKIVGQKRMGQIVKYYYPQYLKKYPKRFNWMDIIVKKFFENLKIEVQNLKKKSNKDDISFENFNLFWIALMLLYKAKVKAEKERRKREQELHEKNEKLRQEFQEKIKNSVNSKQRRK